VNNAKAHSELIHATRLELGREPDFTLWLNSKIEATEHGVRAKPGLGKGSSDLLGILAPWGRLVALEGKTGRGVPSQRQRQFLELIRKRGGFAAVFHSVDEAREALNRARAGHSE